MKEELIEQILQAANLTRACEDVVKNKGAGGVDGMNVKELKSWLDQNRQQLVEQVRNCEYHAQAIRGKEIPKGKGETRLLGIPTVVDRMLQQAVLRVTMFRYEVAFSNYSFGFRPKRNTIQATGKSLNYINSGYQHIVEIDLKQFFDKVDHTILLQLLYRKIKCKTTMCLIRRWLRAPLEKDGKLIKRRIGLPQGSPISPLLANIMLHEMDTEMEKRGLKFVSRKYANIKGKLAELDGWLRNRLRYCIWHDWKKPERKRKNLIRLGVKQGMAYAWSRSNMGGWAIAQSPILGTTITLARLRQRGYVSLSTVYEKKTENLVGKGNTLFPMF
jgi:retron-type reverse transcriptase